MRPTNQRIALECDPGPVRRVRLSWRIRRREMADRLAAVEAQKDPAFSTDRRCARGRNGFGAGLGQAPFRLSKLKGNERSRLPVAAKIAFDTAGATGGTPGSPTPVGASVEGMM